MTVEQARVAIILWAMRNQEAIITQTVLYNEGDEKSLQDAFYILNNHAAGVVMPIPPKLPSQLEIDCK
jgi:hypothetical protein